MKGAVREQSGLMEIQTETFAEILVPRTIVFHGIGTVANGKKGNAFQKIQVNISLTNFDKHKNFKFQKRFLILIFLKSL